MLEKFVIKLIPKVMNNPALLIEMAPVIVVAGIAVAVSDHMKK